MGISNTAHNHPYIVLKPLQAHSSHIHPLQRTKSCLRFPVSHTIGATPWGANIIFLASALIRVVMLQVKKSDTGGGGGVAIICRIVTERKCACVSLFIRHINRQQGSAVMSFNDD